MNGILIINKPYGCTSRDVVNIICKKLKTKKVGHTGTLDPIATGVMVLCIGNALKLVELLTNHDKEYIAKIKLGIETDTLDITGNIIKETNKINITNQDIKKTIKKYIGNIKQEVPIYSAIKVNGKKLYEYARNKEKVELPTREVTIHNIELISDLKDNEFTIKCHVSKGTYIRSLIRDIGESLGVGATMTELTRTKLGQFNINNSYTIEDIEKNNYHLLTLDEAINLPKVIIDKNMEKKIRNGQVLKKFFDEEMAWIIDNNNNILAIYKNIDNDYTKPYRMFL